jgi:precorrin-2 dehydrogenase/sirohydrochlorin ferrochelatase
MTAPRGIPLMVDLAGRRVVVVGAGRVATGKISSLAPLGARITVIAPRGVAAVAARAVAGELAWHRRPYRQGDLVGTHLAVAATSDTAVNDAVAAEADRLGVLCVRVDGGGTAAFMGAVRRGPLTIGVSTAGTSPALARRIRAELAQRYGEEYGSLAALLGELRADPHVRAALAELDDTERAARWRRVLDPDIVDAVRSGHLDSAKELALACLSSSSD